MTRGCVVLGCSNRVTLASKQQKITFHRFPKNDKEKRLWLENLSGHVPENITSHSVICSKHFLSKDVQNFGIRNKLRRGALPTLSNNFVKKSAEHGYALPNSKSDLRDKIVARDKKIDAMCIKLKTINKEMRNVRLSEERAKNALKETRAKLRAMEAENRELKKTMKQVAKVPEQVLPRDAKMYDEEQKQFAITLLSYGNKVYNYLRENVGLKLPHSRSIARWLGNKDGKPGNSDGKPADSDGKPDNSDGEPDSSDGKSDNSDGKPGNSDGKPDNSDGKPANSDGKPDNSDGKPDNSDGKSDNSDGKPGNSDGKPDNSDVKSDNSDGKPDNN